MAAKALIMKKILIIEDEPQMRRNLGTILQMEGFDVKLAEDGNAGVLQARAFQPDLIICDVMMPELDGHGVLRRLRSEKATATIPFIFLTAKGEKTDQRAGMNLGADDYLTKPVERTDLLASVRMRLERRDAHETELDSAKASAGFNPNFESSKPLESLGLTPREAEVLLWVAQGKSNGAIAILLGMAEKTVKKHMGSIFAKLGMEGRNAATIRALEILSLPSSRE